jgi:hypothetical protein
MNGINLLRSISSTPQSGREGGDQPARPSVATGTAATVRVDLAAQTLTLPGSRKVEFPVDAFAKQCLLEGVDELGYILMQADFIASYEAKREGSVNTLAQGPGCSPSA